MEHMLVAGVILAGFIWSIIYLVQVVKRTSVKPNSDEVTADVDKAEPLQQLRDSVQVLAEAARDFTAPTVAEPTPECTVHNPILKSNGKWARKLRGQITGRQTVDSPDRHSLIHITVPVGEKAPIALDTWLAHRMLRYDVPQIKEALTLLTGFKVEYYKITHPKNSRPPRRK